MHVTLDLVLDCAPDAAWEAVHSPAVFRAVSGPWTRVESLEPGGFPERWPGGEHRVRLKLLGVVPMGVQVIRLSDESLVLSDGSTERIVHDAGGSVSGPMRVVRSWHHRMAISTAPAGRTLFRDRLDVGAGILTPVVMVGFWVFWQLRARQLTRLAPGWRKKFASRP
ncbi:hypothetical protein GCM10009792_04660 [Microcella alkalica]|uniref:SRPBCC family protein n=1 Tax=Microcella alkalica TaxID=355930 RepID=A0A839EGV0_9MICO|nr:hypothetical protein [Microcella alkalica]MBA8848788.1 hypothetical protein [Microcella alkalica]